MKKVYYFDVDDGDGRPMNIAERINEELEKRGFDADAVISINGSDTQARVFYKVLVSYENPCRKQAIE